MNKPASGKKLAIYMAGHPGFANQLILHKMTVNADKHAILVYGKIGKLAEGIEKLVDLGIFDKVVYAFDTMGQKENSSEGCLKKIIDYYTDVFKQNAVPISNSVEYYIGVDTLNSYGIFLINNSIPFFYYEGGFSNFFKISKERLHKTDRSIASDPYIELMDKMGISDASNPLIKILANPNSTYDQSMYNFSVFNIKSEISKINTEEKMKLCNFYGVAPEPSPGLIDLIVMNSQWCIRDNSPEKQQLMMLQMYGIVLDYFVSGDIPAIVKPHPLSEVDDSVYSSHFGCKVLPRQFPSECIDLLGVTVRHSYTLGSTGVSSDESTTRLGFTFTKSYVDVPYLDVVFNYISHFGMQCILHNMDAGQEQIIPLLNRSINEINAYSDNDQINVFLMDDSSIDLDFIRNKVEKGSSVIIFIHNYVFKCVSDLWDIYDIGYGLKLDAVSFRDGSIPFESINVIAFGNNLSSKNAEFKYERKCNHLGVYLTASFMPLADLLPREVAQALRDKGGEQYRDKSIDLMRKSAARNQRWSEAELFSMLFIRGTEKDLDECASILLRAAKNPNAETMQLILLKLRNIGFRENKCDQKLLNLINRLVEIKSGFNMS